MRAIWFLTTRKKIHVIEDAYSNRSQDLKKPELSAWGITFLLQMTWRFGSISAGLQNRHIAPAWANGGKQLYLICNGDMFNACLLSRSYWKSIWLLQKSPRDQSIELPLFLRIWDYQIIGKLNPESLVSVKMASHNQSDCRDTTKRSYGWSYNKALATDLLSWWEGKQQYIDVGRLGA